LESFEKNWKFSKFSKNQKMMEIVWKV
jgi:hypothetical protein